MRAESLSVDLQPDFSCINENISDYLEAENCLIFDFFYSLNVPVQRPDAANWMLALCLPRVCTNALLGPSPLEPSVGAERNGHEPSYRDCSVEDGMRCACHDDPNEKR